jgi:hypothetical protein
VGIQGYMWHCEQASRQALREAVGEAEFLRVVLPDSAQLVHAIPRGERFPINFGRDVAAAIAGTPDRCCTRMSTSHGSSQGASDPMASWLKTLHSCKLGMMRTASASRARASPTL